MKRMQMREKDLAIHRQYMRSFQQTPSQDGENAPDASSKYRDAYEILDLPRDATHTQIRQAYRKLALKFHPDRNSSQEAQERWEGVPVAYAMLSNPNERQKYDQTLPVRDALVAFYKRHNPAKLDNATIQTIVDGWKDNEIELFRMLNLKYEIPAHRGVVEKEEQLKLRQALDEARKAQICRDSACSMDQKQDKQGKLNGLRGKLTYWRHSFASAMCCRSRLTRHLRYEATATETPGNPGETGRHAVETPGGTITLEDMLAETTTGVDPTDAKLTLNLNQTPSPSPFEDSDRSSAGTTPEIEEEELEQEKQGQHQDQPLQYQRRDERKEKPSASCDEHEDRELGSYGIATTARA